MIWQCYISLPFSVSHSVSLSFQFYKVKGYDLTRSFYNWRFLGNQKVLRPHFLFCFGFSDLIWGTENEMNHPLQVNCEMCRTSHWTAAWWALFYLKWKWNDDGGSIEDLGDSGDRPDRLLFFYILPVRCVCIYTSPRQHIISRLYQTLGQSSHVPR